uniref:Sex peptide receptor n=2 Tax=Cacopsylla melanoneura TaxID=428564 RepID=A0A8D8VW65_9HEMI
MFHYDQINDQSPLFDQTNHTLAKFHNAFNYFTKQDPTQLDNNTNIFSDQEYDEFLNYANFTLKTIKNKVLRGTSTCFCNSEFRALGDVYKSEVHGILSLMVCTFGIVANLLNIVVLTNKELSATPINRILTGLAVTDLLVMLEYVPFSIYMYFVHVRSKLYFTYTGSLFILIHMHFSQLLHTISIFQTLTLAICRHVAIRFPHKCSASCSESSCYISVLVAYILPILICAPSYFVFSIQQVHIWEDGKLQSLYQLHLSKLAKENNGFIFSLHFWMYSVCIKLLPCLVLSVISYYLIGALRQASKRKHELKSKSAAPCQQSKVEQRLDRTAHMLVAVLLLFLITEFPQGILALLSGILGRCFFESCYQPYGEIMDILALLNGAINFILYCSMSRQFRVTFGQLFKPKNVLGKIVPPTNTDMQSTKSTYV